MKKGLKGGLTLPGVPARLGNIGANALIGKALFGNTGAVIGAVIGASGRSNGIFRDPESPGRFTGNDVIRPRGMSNMSNIQRRSLRSRKIKRKLFGGQRSRCMAGGSIQGAGWKDYPDLYGYR